MARKPKEEHEEEVEVDVSKEPKKKQTFVVRWFNDNIIDDQKDIRSICELTARSAEKQFKLAVRSDNHEVFAMIFFATFKSILEFLKEKQKSFPNYTIQLCSSVNIGYENSTAKDNEKLGNFMPVLQYIGVNRNIVEDNKVDLNAVTANFILWTKLNSKKNVEHYKEIQEIAYNKLLQEYHTDLRTSEAIIPLFCIFFDNVNNLLRMKYREAEGKKLPEVRLNVLGLFKAFYSYDEEGDKECLGYEPSPMMKLSLKSDKTAAG